MTNNTEIAKLKRRLDATFERARAVDQDSELQSDFARYLCILVSGYIERAVTEIVLEHARKTGAPTMERFVERKTRRFANARIERIRGLLGDFDTEWRRELDESLVDEQRDAVDSIVSQRNIIAHGGSVELTYGRIRKYYEQAQGVIERVEEVCRGRRA